MKLYAYVLFVCPLMAQVEVAGMPGFRPLPSNLIPPSGPSTGGSTEMSSATRPATVAPAFLTAPLKSEKSDGKTLYRWSLAAVAAGNAMDTFSSWNRPEANGALATPGSNFDARSMALKSAFIGTSFLIERWALKHNSGLYKPLAWLNFSIAGVLGGVSAHNMSLH